MDCGIITSKSVLLLLSLIFWAAGVALAYVGAYVIKSYNSFSSFVEDRYALVPAAVVIGTGVVMFVIGVVGCCATVRESKVGLTFFLLIILAVFAAEVAAIVLGFVYHRKIQGDLERSMDAVFQKYDGSDSSESRAVDLLQSQLQCCGVDTYTNWTTTPWFATHNNSVPVSCCKNSTACDARLDRPEQLNTQGCEARLEQVLQDVLSYAMLVILGFAIIKFFAILSVCVITCRTGKRSGYQRIYT